MAGQQGARLAAGEAPDIVHAPVMRRQHPPIGRQIEQRDRARLEAALRLLYGALGVDTAMAEHVERDVTGERAVAQRHFVDRTRSHRPAGLAAGHRGGDGVVFQPDGRMAGDRGPEPRQHAAGSAARVEHRSGPLTAPQRPRQFLHHERPQAAIPPHAILDRMHALVFSPLHVPAAPLFAFLPARSAGRNSRCVLTVACSARGGMLIAAYDIFAAPCQPLPPNRPSFRRASSGCCWRRCSSCRCCGWPATSSRRSITTSAAILDVSARWVGGEKLYVEVIDENLPLTFIVHALPVLTAKLVHGSVPFWFTAWVVAGIAASFYACSRLVRLVPSADHALTEALLPPVLLFLFTVLPNEHFGQREHIMFVACAPYLIASMARAEGVHPSRISALAIGLTAGLFLAMKPYYLAIPAAVEIFLLTRRGWRTTFTDLIPWSIFAVALAHLVADVHGVLRVRPFRHAARA